MHGLDGLRALAVVAVLMYHAGLGWIPGGFLGVDVFFVISGYLITSLLLDKWAAKGRVDLKAFWLGRARRLPPAAFLVIAASLAFAVFFLPGEVVGLRRDALASFGYVTNCNSFAAWRANAPSCATLSASSRTSSPGSSASTPLRCTGACAS